MQKEIKEAVRVYVGVRDTADTRTSLECSKMYIFLNTVFKENTEKTYRIK